eukprot:gene40096-63922_t
MPVDSRDWPVPSKLILTVIWVSAVWRLTSAVRGVAGIAREREHLPVFVGGAHGQAQAVGEQRVHFRNVFHQHTARFHPIKDRGGALTVPCQAHQHHVGVALEGLHTGQLSEVGDQLLTRLHQGAGLLRKLGAVFQCKKRAFAVEHADVVGRAHLVDLLNQRLRAHHVAQTHAGQ